MQGKLSLLDERPLHFLIPATLSDSQASRIRRTLASKHLLTALRKGIRQTLRQFPLLKPVRIRIG